MPKRSRSNKPTNGLPDSYAFVMNVRSLQGAGSFQLAEGHELRRATAREITQIKKTLLVLSGFGYPFIAPLWECELPVAPGPTKLLPENKWRYFVIAFRGIDSTLLDLQDAFNLAPVELEIAFRVTHSEHLAGPGTAFHPDRAFQLLKRAQDDGEFFVDISRDNVAEAASIHTLLRAHDPSLLDYKRILLQMSALKGLPYNSPLRFLGYFAILESLLTHPPRPTDPYDSITRQIKKKLILVNRRLPNPIDYGPFGGNSETVWAKMYECRSKVAHGGIPDFTKDLSLLKSQNQALKLVKETTKAVITHALREPQLLIDLREC